MKISPTTQHYIRTVTSVVVAIPLALVFVIGLIGNIEFVKDLFEKGTFANDVFVWFMALPQWAVFLAGFAFAVLALRKFIFKPVPPAQPTAEPAKVHWLSAARFADWDDIDPLAMHQIANLWVGKEPSDKKTTDGEAHTMMIRLSEAIRTRKIKLQEVYGENGNKTAEGFLHHFNLQQMKPNELVDRDTRISRGKLKAYAEKNGEKPKFLYPEVR